METALLVALGLVVGLAIAGLAGGAVDGLNGPMTSMYPMDRRRRRSGLTLVRGLARFASAGKEVRTAWSPAVSFARKISSPCA